MKGNQQKIAPQKGPQLWVRAKTLIPGGSQLLSKRAERFLPGFWPSYYERAKGCEVWDLDGNRFYDFAQMGVGSCVLGYADDEVDAEVISAIRRGSMCTLNSPEEVKLAELLISLHPWSEMARFARSGGEACSIAIRIARAFSGKDKVAFCGYHGWHDWYLSANIADSKNLDGQLLPGLLPAGVPRGLKGIALPFQYNKIETLEKIVQDHGKDIGVIILEPIRGSTPKQGFLEKIRKIADQLKAILIFDEVTSGFRVCAGGIHLTLGVDPDMAVFAKGLGNGYPIAAVLGRKKIMEAAMDTFISSTTWTERVGSAAGIATIKKFQAIKASDNLIRYGKKIIKGLKKTAVKNKIKLLVSGIPPLIYLNFNYHNSKEVQTFFTQEMLKRGFLVGSAIYTTNAYTDKIIDSFLDATNKVFQQIKKDIKTGTIQKRIRGGIIHSGFTRLT